MQECPRFLQDPTFPDYYSLYTQPPASFLKTFKTSNSFLCLRNYGICFVYNFKCLIIISLEFGGLLVLYYPNHTLATFPSMSNINILNVGFLNAQNHKPSIFSKSCVSFNQNHFLYRTFFPGKIAIFSHFWLTI